MSVDDTIRAVVDERLDTLLARLDERANETISPVLTLKEAADYFKVSQGTVRGWVNRDILPRIPEVGTILIPRAACEAFVDEAALRAKVRDR